MDKKIKIIIADDHRIVRAGIRNLLENIPGIEITGEAGNGRQLLEILKEKNADIVFVDIKMPELNGLEATKIISREFPNTKIVILSMYSPEEYIRQAFKCGAAGYLIKDSALTEIEKVISAVMDGKNYISPAAARNIPRDIITNKITQPEILNESIFNLLTQRQREILQLIAEGYNTKEIAFKLHISVKTVETHRQNIMERLGIFDISGLVRYAIRNNLLSEF